MNRLLTPQQARLQVSLTPMLELRIAKQRETVIQILHGDDKRMLVIVGPCSIHDPVSALEYAEKLSQLSRELNKQLCILMRVYVEKPRTELGWQGFLLDPAMDGSGHPNTGIIATRELMKAVVSLDLAVATEYVSPLSEAYIGDCVAWAAIGARSVESQLHRNFISGLSIPVGCKNSRQGSVDAAASMLVASSHPQQYLGVNHEGIVDLIRTEGNANCHVVLRGGVTGPNYDALNLERVQHILQRKAVLPAVIIDCSHDNSRGDYRNQSIVAKAAVQSMKNKKLHVRGIMLESHLIEGKQKLGHVSQLIYGQSVTDCCIGWQETEKLLRLMAAEMSDEKKA